MSAESYCHSVLGNFPVGWKESPIEIPPASAFSINEEDWQPEEKSLVCKTDNLKYIERLLILGTGQQNKYKSGISKISEEDLLLVQKEIDSPNCYKLLDMVADKKQRPPLEMIIETENNEVSTNLLRRLFDSDIISEKQKRHIKMYYLEEQTLEKIGKEYNVTREAIRQSIKTAISKIRALV